MIAAESCEEKTVAYKLNTSYRFDVQTDEQCRWQPYATAHFSDPGTLVIDLDVFKKQDLSFLKRVGYHLTSWFINYDRHMTITCDEYTIWRALIALGQRTVPVDAGDLGEITLGNSWETCWLNSQTLELADMYVIYGESEPKQKILESFCAKFPGIKTITYHSQGPVIVENIESIEGLLADKGLRFTLPNP